MANRHQKAKITVVGIGASAGGVAALTQILPNLPKQGGFSYVVALHLDPTQPSLLVDILEKKSPLPVKRVVAGADILPETIYVVPPDHDCIVQGGKLRLLDMPERMSPRHSIDILFASLAEACGKSSAGVILSGTGSDGTHGMLAIRQAGGGAIAQDPATAEYPGMPQAVIDAGLVDLILPAARIGPALEDIRSVPRLENAARADSLPKRDLNALLTVLALKSKFDFRQYKESTLTRRIERRMAVHKVEDLKAYTALVNESETEADLLFKDLLISVTSFFRDDASFMALRHAVRNLLDRKPRGDPVRIWVAGCATGEEAYSIAILLDDALGTNSPQRLFQIFATDIDTGAIAVARRGFYLQNSIKTVPARLLKKYFTRSGGTYHVAKKIRNMVVFARHDLIQDPPYINLDLMSCRNVLIYFVRPLQDRLIALFHYSLRPGGYLAVGQSESLGQFNNLFTPFDQQGKVFSKIGEARNLPELLRSRHFSPAHTELPQPRPKTTTALKDQFRDLVAEAYAPAGVLVNSRFEIIHVHGNVARFIHLPAGDLSVNVMEMAVPPLRIETQLALQKAQREQTSVRSRSVILEDPSGKTLVTVVAIAAGAEFKTGWHALLLFEERAAPTPAGSPPRPDTTPDDVRVGELEQDLIATRVQLQTSIEQLQSSNENLQSVNEEYQSTAEELQSTNEELQTTNEELQSSNEELKTVNDELTLKSAALKSSNTDLENVLNTVLSGIVVLDRDHRVTRYSAASKQVFDLFPSSIGKPLTEIGSPFDLTILSKEILHVEKTGTEMNRDLSLGNKTFAVKLIPLFEKGSTPSGTVITFSDETEHKRAEQKVRRLATVVEDSNDAVFLVDLDGRVLTWNRGARLCFGYSEEEACKLTVRDLVPERLRAQMDQLIDRIARDERVEPFELKRRTKAGREMDSWLTATLLRGESGVPDAIAMTERDLNEMKLLVAEKDVIRRANQDKSEFLARVSHELRTPLNAVIGFSEIIKDEMFGPIEQHRYVEYGQDIHNSGMYLLALVNDILDLSRIGKPELQIAETDIDLRALAKETVHLLHHDAKKRRIELSVEAVAGLPKLRSDHRALRQVFIVLLSNAIKFTPENGRVSLEMRLEDDGSLRIAVRDTGIGIEKADLLKIGKPFVQIPNRLGTQQLGYGLGLTIAKSLTGALGTKLEFETEIDRGTTVSMRFSKEKLDR